MARTTVSTPVGEVSWEGELKETSAIRFSGGNKIPFSRWVALTNGECFIWISDFLEVNKPSKAEQPAKVTLEEALQDIVIEWKN